MPDAASGHTSPQSGCRHQSLRRQTSRAIRCRQAQRCPGQQTGRARPVEGPSPAIRHQPDMTAATPAAAPSGKLPPHTASALAAGNHSRQTIPEPAGRSGQPGIRLARQSSGTTPRIPPAMPAGDKSPYPGHAAPAGICSRTARRVIPPLSVLHDHDCIRAASPVPVTTLPPSQFVKYRRLTCFLFGHKYCPVLCSAFRGASAHGYLALIPALAGR